jgi:hypothetical protein
MSMIPLAQRSRRVANVLCLVATLGTGACGPGVGSEGSSNEETSSTSDSLTGWTNSPSWTGLGGATSGIAVAGLPRGSFESIVKADVWASGPATGNHKLWRNTLSRQSSTWGGWRWMNDGPSSPAGTGLQGAPSILTRPSDGKMLVVAKDLANVIQWNVWDDVLEEWTPRAWDILGPTPTTCTGSPVVSAGPSGDALWVFALSLGLSPIASRTPVLMATHDDAGTWSAWSNWGAPPSGLGSGPAVVGNSTLVSVWVRGSKGNLYSRGIGPCFHGTTCLSTWLDFGTPAGVTLVGTPAATFSADNSSVDVYSLGSDGNLYVRTDSAGWTFHRAAPSGAAAVAGINPTLAAQYCGTTAGCGLDLVAVGAWFGVSNAVFYSSAFKP